MKKATDITETVSRVIREEEVWTVFVQFKNGQKVVPVQKLFKGTYKDCQEFVLGRGRRGTAGAIVDTDGIKNIFFSDKSGTMKLGASPAEVDSSLRHMTANPFLPFK
jgi:hypothetical protein